MFVSKYRSEVLHTLCWSELAELIRLQSAVWASLPLAIAVLQSVGQILALAVAMLQSVGQIPALAVAVSLEALVFPVPVVLQLSFSPLLAA